MLLSDESDLPWAYADAERDIAPVR